MAAPKGGCFGKILDIDLTSGKISTVTYDDEKTDRENIIAIREGAGYPVIREGQEALIIEFSCYKHFPTHFLSSLAKSCFLAFLLHNVFKFRTYAETFQMNLTSAVSLS